MIWKLVEGNWRWPYRVSDTGMVQKQLPDGKWQTLNSYSFGGQWRVQMWSADGVRKRIQVSKLVVDAFMGGTPPGMLRVHRNGMKRDNAVENIVFMTRSDAAKRNRPGNSRPVFKVDHNGNIVDIYPSTVEAARRNYISQAAIVNRCAGLIKDPYRLDGYNYVYDVRDTSK